MESTTNLEQKTHLTLYNGVSVMIHYVENGPSLTDRMVSVLCAHIAKT